MFELFHFPSFMLVWRNCSFKLDSVYAVKWEFPVFAFFPMSFSYSTLIKRVAQFIFRYVYGFY